MKKQCQNFLEQMNNLSDQATEINKVFYFLFLSVLVLFYFTDKIFSHPSLKALQTLILNLDLVIRR